MTTSVGDDSVCPLASAVKHTLSADVVDDFDWSYVSPDGLGVLEAWAFATTWLSELQGLVGIGVDEYAAQLRVVPNYEWVEFHFWYDQGDADWVETCVKTAVAARAASAVWRALASCRGFGSQEYPLFWKRLFDQTGQTPVDQRYHSRLQPVTDETRLFDLVTFPRYKLVLPYKCGPDEMNRLIRVYCGLDDGDGELGPGSNMLRPLEVILGRLGPILEPSRICPIELTFKFELGHMDESRFNTLIKETKGHHSPVSNGQDLTPLEKLLKQPFVVHSIDSVYFWHQTGDEEGNNGMDWDFYGGCDLQTAFVENVYSTVQYPSLRYRLKFRHFLISSLNITADSLSGGIRHLNFSHRERNDSVPAICSALPYTRSLQSLELSSMDYHTNPLHESDFAWLCYALFHPATTASTWRDLIISRLHYEHWMGAAVQTVSEVCTLMSKGNNLHVVLGYSEARSEGYYTASVREGAVIREQAGEDQSIVTVLKVHTMMDVCVASMDVTQINDWVFVVLVGFGEAWVHVSWIDEIRFRPTGCSPLSTLAFDDEATDYHAFFTLVVAVGSALEYLNVRARTAFDGMCEVIRDRCPRLRSLTLRCRYQDVPALVFPPSLRELQFDLYANMHENDNLDFSEISLRHLDDLVSVRIEADRLPTDADVTQFIQPLLRALPGLRRFYWDDHHSGCDHGLMGGQVTYKINRLITRSMLHQLEFGLDDIAIVHKAPTESVVALLSVVRQHRKYGSAVGVLNRELVVMIARFVGTTVPRDLWVSGA